MRDQIGEVQNEQHRLLQIQQITLARLDALEKVLQEVIIEMECNDNTWVNYFALDHARTQLHFHLQKLVRGLQAAHLCRLSVDLLDGKQLRHIFDMATQQAKTYKYQLMLQHPSDLFQIETSYIHNGQDVNLMSPWPQPIQFSNFFNYTPFRFHSPNLILLCQIPPTKFSQFPPVLTDFRWKCQWPT